MTLEEGDGGREEESEEAGQFKCTVQPKSSHQVEHSETEER